MGETLNLSFEKNTYCISQFDSEFNAIMQVIKREKILGT